MLINVDGDAFMHPLETRDVSAASIIRECSDRGNGVKTPGPGVWLDTPMIEMKNGEGTIEKRIPAMMRMFAKYDIDIREEAHPRLSHAAYQNGGLISRDDGQTTNIENLFVAGEPWEESMAQPPDGQLLLDIIVFGPQRRPQTLRPRPKM